MLYDINRSKRYVSEANNADRNTDELLLVLEEQMKDNNAIESVIIKEKAYYYFMSSSRQLEDVVTFCCCKNDVAVLGIDTTFNLCDLWVTDSCYKNKRLINNLTGNHPVFLGPLLFHFTKDESTFNRFVLEMMAMDLRVSQLKKIGIDMDDAIYNGIKSIIPNVEHLYCVRHLQARDDKKISDLLAKTNATEATKKQTKSRILKDIYGECNGSTLKLGLAEAKDRDEFSTVLQSLEEKWNSLCPGFFEWFQKNRKVKFESSVICSAREGTNVIGMFYQNDIESMHYIEKRNQCFKKESVVDAVRSLRDLALRQENDEIRSLYGAGSYSIAAEYSRFKVDSARWHQWDESRRREHVQKFRKYETTPTDSFVKPKNSGRKPCFQQRKRNDEPPSVIIDLIQENPAENTESISATDDMRFSDPREVQEKKFELHFPKDLPRIIKKCQGMCGKDIKPDDDGMLVRSYGTKTWTDRKTGIEKSKFGPMYVHFNQTCMERYDTENIYGPGNSFDYKRIQAEKSLQEKITAAEKNFLSKLGIKFL